MNGKQAAFVFGVLVIVLTLYDYYFLRQGNPSAEDQTHSAIGRVNRE